MKVEKAELLDVLLLVKPAIGKGGMEDSLSGFLFSGKSVISYNNQIRIECPFTTDFSCVISAEELFKLLQGIKESSIDIGLEDHHLFVNTTTTNAELNIVSEDISVSEFPGFVDYDGLKWEALPEGFIEGISLCLFSVSKDISQGALTCIYVNEDRIFSSDNYRISMYEYEGINASILIPFSSAFELVKFDVKEFCCADSWLHFRTENGAVFTTRLVINTPFPDCLPFFSEEERGIRLRIPKEVKEDVDFLSFFAEGEHDINKKITMTFKKGMITCRGESVMGWVEKRVSVKYEKKPISFVINPVFFSQILENTTTVTLLKDKALFKSGRFSHLLALPVKQ